ncbi:MAG: 16S rRNA (adenine(1518)-N(6)/adenine(1519)-N(6))-dimethyltransferase RsmA [Polyangiales bacterium]
MLDWQDPRQVAARFALRPSRRFSQNFLCNPQLVERIAACWPEADVRWHIELGPGLGTLTRALLRRGHRLVAIELDPKMCDVLRQELGPLPGLRLHAGDAVHVDVRQLLPGQARCRVIGNLPYGVTGAILRNLVAQADRLDSAHLLVQREVAQRLRAGVGTSAYGALTVFVQSVFAVTECFTLRPGNFFPPPKVHSSLVALVPHVVPRAVLGDCFTALVRAAFGQRRKTLRQALAGVAKDRQMHLHWLAQAGIDARRRGESCSIEEFVRLAQVAQDAGTDARQED